MKTQNIQQMTVEIDQHRAADLLVQGDYYDEDTGRGCFIGCLAHGNDIAAVAERYGVPQPLTRLLESIFERLPFDEAADFFSAIPRAIGEDGRDLTRVHWAFLADTLRHLPDTAARDVVTAVTAGMDLLAQGENWPGARAAGVAAAARAAEATEATAWVTEAAAWAAAQAAEAAVAAVAAEVAQAAVAWAAAEVAQAAQAAVAWAAVARAMQAAGAGAKETRRQRDAILRLIRELEA